MPWNKPRATAARRNARNPTATFTLIIHSRKKGQPMWIMDGKVYFEAREIDLRIVREVADKTGVELDDVARVIAAYLTVTQPSK
jgi:hypothetical protein